MASERISQRAQLCLRKTVVSHLKRMEAGSLSSAAVEVKISGFVLKIRSLRGAMWEFDGTEDRI